MSPKRRGGATGGEVNQSKSRGKAKENSQRLGVGAVGINGGRSINGMTEMRGGELEDLAS